VSPSARRVSESVAWKPDEAFRGEELLRGHQRVLAKSDLMKKRSTDNARPNAPGGAPPLSPRRLRREAPAGRPAARTGLRAMSGRVRRSERNDRPVKNEAKGSGESLPCRHLEPFAAECRPGHPGSTGRPLFVGR
jgi:hypothetical protein